MSGSSMAADKSPESQTSLTPTRDGEQPPVKKQPGKRKPHRKSRNGCKNCRQSRVKCDEKKPSCSYCIRHSETCSFLSTAPNTIPSMAGLAISSRTASPSTRNTSSSPTGLAPGQLCPHLHMKELQLIHQYTVSTAGTVAQIPENLDIWINTIPQIAAEHPFLMHGLLSIAALHLSYLRPEQKQEYTVIAANHEIVALPLFRSEAANMSERNIAAVFAFSALVVCYAMAAPDQPGGFPFTRPGSTDGLPEWVHLLRGLSGLMRPYHYLLANTPLRAMLDRENLRQHSLDPTDELHLSALASLFTYDEKTSMERLEEVEVYRHTLGLLTEGFKSEISASIPGRPMPYLWFCVVSENYLRCLSERKPEALVLLAFECVLLKRMEPCWFLDGSARRILNMICERLPLEWRFWIEWPIQEIGLY